MPTKQTVTLLPMEDTDPNFSDQVLKENKKKIQLDSSKFTKL